MKYKFWNIPLLLAVLIAFASCEDTSLTEEEIAELTEKQEAEALNNSLKNAVFDIMEEWYLWNDQLPSVNINDYDNPDDLLSALMNSPTDKWSYIEKEDEYKAYFEKGEYEGYGVRMARDFDGNLRVAFVYDDSPFGRAGVKRSWIIDKVDGTSIKNIDGLQLSNLLEGNSHRFDFIKVDGSLVNENLTKTTIGINSVLNADIILQDNSKIGYLAFNSFLATSEEELTTAFQKFADENIEDLIIDLRYNGGGRVNIAEWMASNIIGNAGNGKNFIKYNFNSIKASEFNESVPFNAPTIPLNLDRIVVITSRGSASASELLINGLRPFIEVKLVGDDTYGKPVGSFPFFHEGYAISPISFKIVNDQGIGEYYDGIKADVYIEDDLNNLLGSPNESRLKEALYYLRNNTFSGTIARQNLRDNQEIEMTGFRLEIGAF